MRTQPRGLQRVSRAARVLGALLLAAFVLATLSPAPNEVLARLSPAPDLRPSDAIVVLGSGVDEGGRLGEASLRRALEGIRLARAGLAPTLLMLGPAHPGGEGEATVRARLAESLGVPAASILTVLDAKTTAEEASRSRDVLPAARSILLVTGGQHMPRAAALFRRAGFDVRVAPVDELGVGEDRPEGRLGIARGVAQELVGWVYYRLSGRI